MCVCLYLATLPYEQDVIQAEFNRFEIRVFLLLDWLLTKAKWPSLLYRSDGGRLDSELSKGYLYHVKCNLCPEFKLVLPCPFHTMIAITTRTPPFHSRPLHYIYIYIYILQYIVVTISVSGLVLDQIRYNLESAQSLCWSYYII